MANEQILRLVISVWAIFNVAGFTVTAFYLYVARANHKKYPAIPIASYELNVARYRMVNIALALLAGFALLIFGERSVIGQVLISILLWTVSVSITVGGIQYLWVLISGRKR